MSALALGRQMLEGWNAGRTELIFATFDPDIVIRPDDNWPEGVFFGTDSAQRFWESVRENMGEGEMIVEEEHDLGDRALWRVRQLVRSIGLHPVEIVSIDGQRVRVRNLEALDGTPVVDVKPVLE